MVQVNHWQIQDFPLGGTNLRRRHFSAKTCVKMKELGPVGGMHYQHLHTPGPVNEPLMGCKSKT